MGSDRRRELETAVREAQSDLVSARAELTEMTTVTQSLRARIEELETELAQQRVGLATMDLTQVEEPLLVLDAQLREAVEAQQRIAHRVAELEARRAPRASGDDDADPLDQVRELTERIQVLQIQLEAARTHEDELTTEAVYARGLVTDLGERLAELGEAADRAEALQVTLAETQAALEGAAAARDEAEAHVETLEQRVTALTEESETARTALDDATAGLSEAREKIRDLHELLAVTTLERDGARSELMRLMDDQQAQTSKIATLELEIERVSAETAVAIDQARAETTRAEAELEETRELLKAELVGVRAHVDEMTNERDGLIARAAELEAVVETDRSELAQMLEDLDAAAALALAGMPAV